MKRRFLLLASLITVITAGRCKKVLEESPTCLVKENYYTNDREVTAALNGVYDILSQETMWGGQIPIRHNATTDESYFSYQTFPTGPFRNNHDPSDTYVTTLWRNLYTGIERAN